MTTNKSNRKLLSAFLLSIFLTLNGFLLFNIIQKEEDTSSQSPSDLSSLIDPSNEEKVLGDGNKIEYKLNVSTRLPARKEDYFDGRFQNALLAANQINQIKIINSSKVYTLLGDDIITINPESSYFDTEQGFGAGYNWAVTSLGHTQDKANRLFHDKFEIDLFVFAQRNSLEEKTTTFEPVNDGFGYIIDNSVENFSDYNFQVNPEVYDLFPYARVFIRLEANIATTGYEGYSIQGKIFFREN